MAAGRTRLIPGTVPEASEASTCTTAIRMVILLRMRISQKSLQKTRLQLEGSQRATIDERLNDMQRLCHWEINKGGSVVITN